MSTKGTYNMYPDCTIDIDIKSTTSGDNVGKTSTHITITFSHQQYAKIYSIFLGMRGSNTAPLAAIKKQGQKTFFMTLEAPTTTATTESELEYPIEINETYLEISTSEAAEKWQNCTGLWRKWNGGRGRTDKSDEIKRLRFVGLFKAIEFQKALEIDERIMKFAWDTKSCRVSSANQHTDRGVIPRDRQLTWKGWLLSTFM